MNWPCQCVVKLLCTFKISDLDDLVVWMFALYLVGPLLADAEQTTPYPRGYLSSTDQICGFSVSDAFLWQVGDSVWNSFIVKENFLGHFWKYKT